MVKELPWSKILKPEHRKRKYNLIMKNKQQYDYTSKITKINNSSI